MGGACSTNGKKGMHEDIGGKGRRKETRWKDQDVGGWTILK
jgi:hypothetical protein